MHEVALLACYFVRPGHPVATFHLRSGCVGVLHVAAPVGVQTLCSPWVLLCGACRA